MIKKTPISSLHISKDKDFTNNGIHVFRYFFCNLVTPCNLYAFELLTIKYQKLNLTGYEKIRSLLPVPVLVIGILCCCNEKAYNKEEDVTAFNTFYKDYLHHVETVSLDSIMLLWDDNAKCIAPNEPTIVWKENIRASFKEMLESISINMIPYGEFPVVVSKDIAYSHYNLWVIMTPKNGGLSLYTDLKGLSVFKRQKDGIWKTAGLHELSSDIGCRYH